MKKHNNRGWWVVLTILLLIIIDQAIKIWVKTHMHLGESIHVTGWFQILFIENRGMAWGMTFINKIVLTLFRVAAVSAIGYYIAKIVKMEKIPSSYLLLMVMIFAGAAGNIFDCLLYGQLFTASTPFDVAQFVGWGGTELPVLQGMVVDMFYFPLFHWPDWMPLVGGNVFFSPVFNFADACISVGVICLLLFYSKQLATVSSVFSKKSEEEGDNQNVNVDENNSENA